MSVVFHADPDAFLAAARDVLSRSPASEAFVVTWCAQFKRRPPPSAVPRLFATSARGAARGLGLRLGPNRVLLQRSDPDACVALAEALLAAGADLPGVHGAEEACAAFASRWGVATGKRWIARARLRNHGLARVRPAPAAPGRMRGAHAADLDWLVDANDRFVAETGIPPAPEGTRAMVEGRIADDRYRLWERDGERVAFLGATSLSPRFGRVGPVWTPSGHRGRGYATSLVSAASGELLARGVERVTLVTDLAHPTSNAIYARIGYEPIDDEVELDFVER